MSSAKHKALGETLRRREKQRIDSIENADNLKIATLEERINKLEAALANITVFLEEAKGK